MSNEPSNAGASENIRLDELIGRFLEAEDLGQTIDLEAMLQDAPDLREEFLAFVKEHCGLKRKHTGYSTTPYVEMPKPNQQAILQKTQPGVRVGQVLGDCQILQELGRGGMGVVYVGKHVRLKDLRAIKILPRDKVTDDSIRRFRKEAQTAAKMNHLHIINIHDVGHDQNVHYIVMQYIDGQTLKGYLDRHLLRSDGRPMLGRSALRLMVPVLDALAAMHSRGLVHRDIKPNNIMVTDAVSRRQHVVLMDFGLVRDESDGSQSNAIVGTPAYMAKEQAIGDVVDSRCDLYAVGATLYYLLTARHPYEGKAGRVQVLAAQGAPPTPLRELRPDLPDQICKIIERAMEPSLDRRYSRAVDMLKDITAASATMQTLLARRLRPPKRLQQNQLVKPPLRILNQPCRHRKRLRNIAIPVRRTRWNWRRCMQV